MLSGMSLNVDNIEITQEILSLVAEIDEFKGAWKALGRLAPERLSALRRVATIESIGSSTRIEGSKLSDGDVKRLLSDMEIKRFETRDEQEVAGYAETLRMILDSSSAIDLTESNIRQLHRDLLRHSRKDACHRGEYKTHPNHVSAFDGNGNEIGVVFRTASPFDTPRLMEELVAWTGKALNGKSPHPLLAAAIFVVAFLETHPFQDGNGRLSRILTTLILLRSGYDYVPYSSMESVIEQGKESYYLALRRTQGTVRTASPDWQPWLAFFLRSLQRQKARLQVKMERERLMAARLPPLSLEIIELARRHESLKNARIVELTGANRNTVKRHLANLVSAGHLRRQGTGKGTVYFAG